MSKVIPIFLILSIILLSCLITSQSAQSSNQVSELTWVKKTSMPQGGAVFGAALVNDKIYAFGGYYYNGTIHSTVVAYDPTTDTWETRTSMPTPIINFAIATCENRIYLIGGQEFEGYPALDSVLVYNPTTDEWTTAAPLPSPRALMQANVINNKIYVIGGSTIPTSRPTWENLVNTTEIYDPTTDTWSTGVPAPNPVDVYASAVLNEKIYVIGGFQSSGSLGTTQIYDSLTDKWTFGATPPRPVTDASAGATTGVISPRSIYVFGGFNEDGKPTSSNQVYDPTLNSWSTAADVPDTQNSRSTIAVFNDTMYLMGGLYSALIPGDLPFTTPGGNASPPFPAINYQYFPVGYGQANSTYLTTPSPSPIIPYGSSLIAIVLIITIVCALAILIVKRLKVHKKH